MIRSLHIANFRGFHDVVVEDLRRVNLVIGSNDSGKTSLLGAAAIGFGSTALEFIATVLNDGPHAYPWRSQRAQIRGLFRDADEERGFRCKAYLSDGTAVGFAIRAVPGLKRSREGDRVWQYQYEGVDIWHVLEFTDQDDCLPLEPTPNTDNNTYWVFAAPRLDDSDIEAFDRLFAAGTEHRVLGVLRKFAPHVREITRSGDDLLVKFEGSDRRLPITALGDGARKVFLLATALSADCPLVMLDEVENGLHHSALPQLWDVFAHAGPDRQIFATTHSEECLRAAVAAFADQPGDFCVLRTQRGPDGPTVTHYPWELAHAALDAGWELRG